ncbi:MAG: RES domain-containing protein [Ignavibacteriae bacterium]|nr:MAG: RES domain-containing protein [Ignavibacteriota bacterium]
MIIYRLCLSKYAEDLTGSGAKTNGGRWNSIGNPVTYCSENRALTLLEFIVNLPFKLIQTDLVIVSIDLPDEILIEEVQTRSLPVDWNTYPIINRTKEIGDDWIKKGTSLLLKVPSAIIPQEYNYLINPSNKEMEKVKISAKEKLNIDKRILP